MTKNELSKRKDYERFKLEWMLDHGYTLKDLIGELKKLTDSVYTDYVFYYDPSCAFDDFENCGFGGKLYPSYDEWLKNETNLNEEENVSDEQVFVNKDMLEIELDKDTKLITAKNKFPYDKQIDVYLKRGGDYIDVARVNLEELFYEGSKPVYDNSKISLSAISADDMGNWCENYNINVSNRFDRYEERIEPKHLDNSFSIDIGDGIHLVALLSSYPYDKEVGIYLEKNNVFQDIVRICPSYDIDNNENVIYTNSYISIKVYSDENNEDFQDDFMFDYENEFKELKEAV